MDKIDTHIEYCSDLYEDENNCVVTTYLPYFRETSLSKELFEDKARVLYCITTIFSENIKKNYINECIKHTLCITNPEGTREEHIWLEVKNIRHKK